MPNAFAADPNLQQVVAKTFEGGVRGKFSDNIKWNAGLYNTQSDNDIQFIASNASGFGFFKNVGETRRRGLELGLIGKYERWNLAANYGFVDATFQSDFVVGSPSNSSADAGGKINVARGDRIPGIARQTLKMRVGYDITPSWSVGSNILIAAGQFARGDENNQDINGKVPGYAVVNLDTHYSVSDNWKLFAKVNNLFDKKYETFGVLGNNIFNNDAAEQFRSPAAPLAAWVGVTYEFDKPKGGAGKSEVE